MTQLHAGGKFDNADDGNAYKVSGGLHGVGVSVVNALSDFLDLTIWRDGEENYMRFRARRCGRAPEGSSGRPNGRKKGTRVTFMPSAETFKITEFDFDKLEHRYRELAFLNSGVRLFLIDARHAERSEVELYYEGGIAAFVKYLDRTKVVADARSGRDQRPARRRQHRCRARMERQLLRADVLCFTNNIPQRDGGTHLAAFRAALTRTLNNYAEKSGAEEGEGHAHRRRHARRADRDRLGQAARSQVLVADQGQAGLLRSAPAARKPDGRQAGRMAGGESGARQDDRPEDHRRRRRARGRQEGARG